MTSLAGAPATYEISGNLRRPQPALRYRAALVLVAIAMVILPLLYAVLVLGAARLIWWHATANTWIIEGRTNQWLVLLYLAPIIAGAILVFFLVKPIVARPAARREDDALARDDAPELFGLIEAICRQVGSPVPRRVVVDCNVNASAGFLPGVTAVLRRDLVLTVGLPLVAGLSVREFAGVLAHEFGHFSQRGGMRLTALVRGINHWFARVVYVRDRWDEKLDEWSQSRDARAFIVVGLARGGVWVSRRVLTLLMQAGHVVSCLLLRQMEYDADAYEIQIAGSATFARTFVRLRELNVGARLAYGELRQAWQAGTAPMDLPRFMVEHEQGISPSDRAALQRMPEQRTGMWDTHPSDADRVSAGERAAAAGLLVGGTAPATSLFRNFSALCIAATRHHYQHELGLETTTVTLVDAEVANDERVRRQALRTAFTTVFGDYVSVWRPVHLPLSELENLPDAQLMAALIDARKDMTRDREVVAEHYRQYDAHGERRIKAIAAEEFLLSGGTIQDVGTMPELAEPSIQHAQETQAWATAQQNDHNAALRRFEDAAGRRLGCAVLLADRANANADMKTVAAALAAVSAQLPVVLEIHQHLSVLNLLARSLGPRNPEPLRYRFEALAARMSRALKSLADGLRETPCPESLCKQPMSVGAFCRAAVDAPDYSPAEVLDRFFTVSLHLLGLLAATALRVEETTTD